MTHLIDGKTIAKEKRDAISRHVNALNTPPGLAVILVGDDPASQVYVRHKIKACADVGITSTEYRLPASATYDDVHNTIDQLNKDDSVHGILLQLPLPDHLDSDSLIQRIAPHKDVDGLTYTNIGKLVAGDSHGLYPCTPQGSLALIKSVKTDLNGMNAVVIGRSLLFGKPMASLLLAENCTVTTAHSRTKNLPALSAQADILIAAVGKENMVKADWIKDNAIIIDVGINRKEDGKLCGDVDTNDVIDNAKARAITPVPGGVGPMTIAFLLANTLQAASMIESS